MMDLDIPGFLYTFNAVSLLMMAALMLTLIWGGTLRMAAGTPSRLMTATCLSGGLLLWLGLALYLGRENAYWAANNLIVPTIQFGVFLPLMAGLWLLLRSKGVARLVDAIPFSWIVGVQSYRILGGIFLVLWADELLPWEFAMPAGVGDVLTGCAALVIAGMIMLGKPRMERTVIWWCWFGLADLAVAVSMGALTSPGRFHHLSLDAPNLYVSAYPLVMVPTFLVPLSAMLHVLCLWKLRRLQTISQREAQAGRVAA